MKVFDKWNAEAVFFLSFFWAMWFMAFTCRSILSPFMPLIEDEFLISHARAGSLFTAISFGNGLSLFVMGILSGVLGYKRSILFSFLLTGMFLILLSLSKTFFLLYPLLFAIGFTTGAYLPAVLPTLTRLYHEKFWGKVLPIHDSAASSSVLVAPFIAIFLMDYMDWREIFFGMGIIFFAFTFLLYLLTRRCENVKVIQTTRELFKGVLKDRSLWLLNAIWIFSAGANIGLYYVMPLFLAKELLLDLSYANRIVGISRIGSFLFSVFVGFILDFFEIKKFLFSLLFLSGILTFFIPLVPLNLLPTTLFLEATLVTGFFPSCFVLVSRIFPFEKRSFAMGFMVSFGSTVGIGFIPYVLGVFGDRLSFGMGIELLGLTVVGTSFLIFGVRGSGQNAKDDA